MNHVEQVRLPRALPGQRWLNIGLRCAHLVGISGLGGAFLLGAVDTPWRDFGVLAVVSGGLLALLYIWTSLDWLLQIKGQIIVLKLALLALGELHPAWRAELFILVIVLSGIFAHAPAHVRGFAWGRPVQKCGAPATKEGVP